VGPGKVFSQESCVPGTRDGFFGLSFRTLALFARVRNLFFVEKQIPRPDVPKLRNGTRDDKVNQKLRVTGTGPDAGQADANRRISAGIGVRPG
jgi:hypothetical protein